MSEMGGAGISAFKYDWPVPSGTSDMYRLPKKPKGLRLEAGGWRLRWTVAGGSTRGIDGSRMLATTPQCPAPPLLPLSPTATSHNHHPRPTSTADHHHQHRHRHHCPITQATPLATVCLFNTLNILNILNILCSIYSGWYQSMQDPAVKGRRVPALPGCHSTICGCAAMCLGPTSPTHQQRTFAGPECLAGNFCVKWSSVTSALVPVLVATNGEPKLMAGSGPAGVSPHPSMRWF
jgi:hypothetical protein